jgi:hypothetical protein
LRDDGEPTPLSSGRRQEAEMSRKAGMRRPSAAAAWLGRDCTC